MTIPSASLKTYKGWEPTRKPRCASCKGEMAYILLAMQNGETQYAWECMSCGKTQPVDGSPPRRKPYKKRRR